MRYRVKYLSPNPIEWLIVHVHDSYTAFQTAVTFIDEGKAIECIVYIADGNEWVKVANVRKN